MLNKSLAEVGVTNVKVVAIINDTTGTLVAGSHDYPDTAIGLILGTGTNGSYMEKAHRIVRLAALHFVAQIIICIFEPAFKGGRRGKARRAVSLTQSSGPGETTVHKPPIIVIIIMILFA